MDATTPYLNPVELFDLTDRIGLKASDLRKAKKRFLTELELDGKEDFEYHGRLFTRNDLDRVSQEAEDDAMLGAYVAAAEAKGLSAFLASGQTKQDFDGGQLFNPRLQPILKSYFAPAFNQAFGRAVAGNDQQTVGKMVLWKAESAGISPSELYQNAYRNLDAKIETLAGTVDAYLRDPKSPAAQSLRGMKAFEDNFPKSLVSVLPSYFTDLTNKLADRLTPYIVRLNNERENPRMALALTKSILRLEYLSEDKRTELKKIGRKLRDNVNVANHNREAQSTGSGGSSAGSIIWMIIVLVVMLFRIGSCVASQNRYSSRPSYRSSTSYTNSYRTMTPADYQKRYAINLRKAVRNGHPPSTVTLDSRADIDPMKLLTLFAPNAGVREANEVLKSLAEDTVYHIQGYAMYRPTMPFQPAGRFREATGRDVTPKDRDTSKLFLTLVEINEKLEEKERVRKINEEADRLERQARAEKAKQDKLASAAEREANRAAEKRANAAALAELGRKAFQRQPQNDILGPRARMPANYSLLLKTKLSERERLFVNGPIKKVKVGIDDPEVGAVLVWQDTLGLRQIRVSATRSIPLVFKAASGKIDKLLEGYVVYGKRWSDQEVSPWGGEGWYKDVLCYCGPDDHEAFINGKKATRKNLWLPSKKADPKKSMSPNAWLRGAKRLK